MATVEDQLAALRQLFSGGLGTLTPELSGDGSDASGYQVGYRTPDTLYPLMQQARSLLGANWNDPTLQWMSRLQGSTNVSGLSREWNDSTGYGDYLLGGSDVEVPQRFSSINDVASSFAPNGATVSLPAMDDPFRPGKRMRYNVFFNPDGSFKDVDWQNVELSGGWLSENGWMLPVAAAAAGFAGLGAAGAGTGGAGGVTAGAIEGAAGLPELGMVAQTGLGGTSMALPTTGLGGLMEGVAPALPSGTGLGLTGGSGITGGTLTSSPLLTGGGLAPGLEGLATVGGSSFGWLGDLAKSALGKDGWLPSVLNAFSQNQQGNIQRDWAERLYQDRAQFLQRLARTYTNPEEFLSGPEYQALSKTTLDKLQRQDAAKGRLATDVQRQKLMQDYAFEYLNKYRSGLAGAAGLTQTTGIPELDKSGAANIWGTLNAPLAQIARGVTNDSFDIGRVVDRIFNLGSWFE